jgi:hypothetical protein
MKPTTLIFKPLVLGTTTTVLLALLVGFCGGKTAQAKSPSATPSVNSQNSSFTIAQSTPASNPLYGAWKLTYSVDGIVYESVLSMNGYSGRMRTRYFDPNINRTQVVDQTMSLRSSSRGLVLLGYNPVYAGTNTPHPTYNADNFLFQISPDGSLGVATCDDAGQCSDVDIEAIR